MLDELLKALGPVAGSVILGTLALAAAIMAFYKGFTNPRKENIPSMEDIIALREAYRQLQSLEQNSARMIVLLEKQIEATNHVVDAIWNRDRGIR
jgi:hypothetical protein